MSVLGISLKGNEEQQEASRLIMTNDIPVVIITGAAQPIKTLKTDNTAAQTPSANESIAGSGTINLHKVAKTGSYNDLNDKPDLSAYQPKGSYATLDENGKVPSSQLPSYVDDVIEGYYSNGKFYSDSAKTKEITGEGGKIYTDLTSNKTYRWGGTAWVEISASLAIGETAGTAYDGASGKKNADDIVTLFGNINDIADGNVNVGYAKDSGMLGETPPSGYVKQIKVGSTTYNPTNSVITLGNYASSDHTHTFASLTSKPTTLDGYGITDAYTNTETDSKLSAKQDKLVSGTNIKTVNGSSLLGSGDVAISAQDSRIYDYTGETYGHCYGISSPERDYSTQIGESGFTVDGLNHFGDEVNLLQVNSDIFQYRQSDVMTGATKYLQSAYFKHWYGTFVCPSNTYYYRLIAKAMNSGSSVNLYQTITIRGTIGGWGSSEQCEFMYVVALRNNNFSADNNIRKTIFRGSTYTEESTIASNTGLDIVTHRNSSTGELYIYLRSYGSQKYSQYDIIVTADGQDGVVTLPTDINFYTSSSGTLVSGSQLLSSTQNQCIEITNKNLVTINGHSLIGSGNLGIPTYPGDNFFIKRVASYSNGACLYKRPSGQTSLPRLYNVLTPWNVYLILPYQSPWFTFNYGDLQQWPAIAFLEIASGYNFFLRVYIKDSPYVYEWQNEDMSTNVVAFWNCTIYKIGR